MTNEEAIKEIQKWLDGCPFADTKEAFNLAIKALKTGEVYMTGVDYNLYIEGYKDGKRDFEQKQGEWNEIQAGMFACPFCGARPHNDFKNFCAKCGADMRGDKNGDDE